MLGRRTHCHKPFLRRLRLSALVALLGLGLNIAVPVILARAALAMVADDGPFPPVCIAYPANPLAGQVGAPLADGRHCPLCLFHTSAADMAAPAAAHDPSPLPVAEETPWRPDRGLHSPEVASASPRGPPFLP